jgi:hypothetical protein
MLLLQLVLSIVLSGREESEARRELGGVGIWCVFGFMNVLRVRGGVAVGQKQCCCEVAAEWERVRWQRRAFRECGGLEGGEMEEQRMQFE